MPLSSRYDSNKDEVKNVNQQSEGRAELCAGYFTITGTNISQNPRVWQDNNIRYLSFANSANLNVNLKHALNVIVHLRECSVSHPLTFKATLIKHQYAKTPKSVIVNTRKTGRMLILDR